MPVSLVVARPVTSTVPSRLAVKCVAVLRRHPLIPSQPLLTPRQPQILPQSRLKQATVFLQLLLLPELQTRTLLLQVTPLSRLRPPATLSPPARRALMLSPTVQRSVLCLLPSLKRAACPMTSNVNVLRQLSSSRPHRVVSSRAVVLILPSRPCNLSVPCASVSLPVRLPLASLSQQIPIPTSLHRTLIPTLPGSLPSPLILTRTSLRRHALVAPSLTALL